MSDFLTRITKLSPQRLALLANELNERLQALESERSAPVAIVGMGCRYPGGADDPESFWALLRDGVDAIREVPADRWDVDALYHPDPDRPGRMATRWGGFIEAPDRFDPKFFGIAPAEAITMDPQQRLLLETAWEALEDAGISPADLAGTATGVFVGLCNSDYAFHALRAPRERITPYFGSGLSHAVASGRISYLLGLQGPSVTVDTSCSASLMAVHLACQSLRRRESDLALAGGANLILSPEITIALSRSRMMAPDGRCKAFSDNADGFVRAEGSGIIVLKRLRDALSDRNRILAVIRGTAANQDGKSSGLTAPNGPSQEAVLRAALADAGMATDDLQYIEAHGTGTALGDPIEVGALAQVFSDRSPKAGPLRIGSVKSNLGHLESAAGIAGLMKLVLALQHREIPATLHLGKPNQRIEWEALPIRLSHRREPWPEAEGLRAGGVSSFGFSGTNVHAIVQEAPLQEMPEEPAAHGEDRPRLVVLSARTETALRLMTDRLANWLHTHPDLPFPGVARTLTAGRSHFEYRLAMTAGSCEELLAKLRRYPDGDLVRGRASEHQPRIGFAFAGMPDLSLQALVESVPMFRERLRQSEATLSADTGRSLTGMFDAWYRGHCAAVPAEFRPALSVTVQYAFAELLQSCRVEPALVSGSGAGAITAACCAGVLRIEDGLRLALAVGRADAGQVEILSQTIQMEQPRRPWFSGEAEGLLAQWIRRARLMGAALPGPEEQKENGRAWVVIGDPAGGESLPHPKISLTGRDGLEAFARATAELYVAGCSPDLSRLYGQTIARTVALPTYPFERERYWLEVDSPALPEPLRPADRQAGSAKGAERDASSDWLYEIGWESVRFKALSAGQEPIRLAAVLEKHLASPASEALLRIGDANLRLQEMCAGYALRALEELGLRQLTGETFTLDQVRDRLQIVPERFRIAGRMLGMLAEDGMVERIGERFRLANAVASLDPDAELATLGTLYPEIETELRILKRCADGMSAVLRGACDPMQLMFAAGSIEETEQIYEKSPVCRYFNEAAREIIRGAVSHIHGRAARILEIGAGTGATTASVLPALAGQNIRYTFTDLSPVFLTKAREKFRAYPGVDYKLLNAERDPVEQGFEEGGFDIVLAANVLHATANLRETVRHARQLLRPGGMLVLIEGSRPDRWLDLTLGLTDGWWRFADSELRPEHPLISSETWQQLLREQDLHFTRAIRYTERNGEPSQQVLLAGCVDSQERTSSAPANRRRWMIFADQGGVGDALEGLLRSRSEACEIVQSAGHTFDPEAVLASMGGSASDNELHAVYLWSLNAHEPEEAMDLCAQIPVRLIQRLSAVHPKAKLWLVTRGAQPVRESRPSTETALQAMTWGIGRVLGLEQPDLLGRLIDIDPECTPDQSAQELFREIMQQDVEDQIVLRSGERLAPRLRHLAAGSLGPSATRLRRDGSYLVTGAFGKVGRLVTRWLAESGAGHLILVSRTGLAAEGDPVAEERTRFVRGIRELGVPVTVITGDIASQQTVDEVFRLFGRECPPLRGVLHMATSQKTSELSRVTAEEMTQVLRPKVLGGWLLARAMQAHRPDFFVGFSSIAALLGARYMAAYAAANQFLDSFAAAQRAQGSPMISVNWGAWMVSEGIAQLRDFGLVSMPVEQALTWMPQILGATRAEAMIGAVDWKKLKAVYEARRVRPILSELGNGEGTPDAAGFGNDGFTANLRGPSIAEVVLAEAARVLGFRGGDYPPLDIPLTELGLDSLMAVDLRNRLQTAIGRDLPSTIVFDYPTVSKLTAMMETMAWAAAGNSPADERTEQDEVRI